MSVQTSIHDFYENNTVVFPNKRAVIGARRRNATEHPVHLQEITDTEMYRYQGINQLGTHHSITLGHGVLLKILQCIENMMLTSYCFVCSQLHIAVDCMMGSPYDSQQ
jgi:hypothetical protein